MSNEKLDSLSKVLVATSAINYMANTLYSANQQMKYVVGLHPEEGKAHVDGITHRDEVLSQAVKGLADIMEELGNCMNEHDCISPIDVRITKEAFSVIIKGQDDVEQETIPESTRITPLFLLPVKPEIRCNKCGEEEIPDREFAFCDNPHGEGRILEQADHCKKCKHLIQTLSVAFKDEEEEQGQKDALTFAKVKFTVR